VVVLSSVELVLLVLAVVVGEEVVDSELSAAEVLVVSLSSVVSVFSVGAVTIVVPVVSVVSAESAAVVSTAEVET